MSDYPRDPQDAVALEQSRRVVKYPLAERFKAVQGEGQFAGTPMAFMRLVGCSVGHKVCTHCDTEFDNMRRDLGGGLYTIPELLRWAEPYPHLCLTGGEPLDRDLRPFLEEASERKVMVHLETSGTKNPDWLTAHHFCDALWIAVSPKPGYIEDMIHLADEVKVIIGGLGDGPGWPTVEDAVRWADGGQLVYVQPRNSPFRIDKANLDHAIEVVDKYPQLRLSVQMHKFLGVR